MKNYRVTNLANDTGEIIMYGPIGNSWFEQGITASQFQKDLKRLGDVKSIDLRINSMGGEVNDARAIYTLLNIHPADVAVHIDGLAASAASFIAMAGDTVEISEGAFVMIHNAATVAFGDAAALTRTAELLTSFSGEICKTYVDRTGNSEDQVQQWMDAETWFCGNEAVEAGFADSLVPNKSAVACVGNPLWQKCLAFKKMPRALRPNRAAALDIVRGINR